jgi:multisubunit Na+/H+ antiporter MnhG subunit
MTYDDAGQQQLRRARLALGSSAPSSGSLIALRRRTGRAARADTVRALLAHADPVDRMRLQARLERAAAACGCTTGGVALLVAGVAVVAWWVLARDGEWILWAEAGVALLLVIAAAVIGKLLGLATADVWLWTTRRRLERRVKTSAPAGTGERQ